MFWDSSALVPTLVPAPESAALAPLLGADRSPTIWWGSPVECRSALHRHHRDAGLRPGAVDEALRRLATLVGDVDVVEPTRSVRDRAGRLLAHYPLRAGDALHLAAALAWAAGVPDGSSFVCLDLRLREAAGREGFALLPA